MKLKIHKITIILTKNLSQKTIRDSKRQKSQESKTSARRKTILADSSKMKQVSMTTTMLMKRLVGKSMKKSVKRSGNVMTKTERPTKEKIFTI
jgi:hypothetical protein